MDRKSSLDGEPLGLEEQGGLSDPGLPHDVKSRRPVAPTLQEATDLGDLGLTPRDHVNDHKAWVRDTDARFAVFPGPSTNAVLAGARGVQIAEGLITGGRT
jgi:hypothetical protein